MGQRTFVTGDIHGCYTEMMLLYKKFLRAGLIPEKDKVIFLGDYIDRGIENKKVVTQLLKWQKKYKHWIFLKGNHEDLFEDAWIKGNKKYGYGCWSANGGNQTLWEYNNEFPKSHIDFLTKRPLLYEDEKYVYVHAGLIPGRTIEECKGSVYEHELLWIRDDFINSSYNWKKKIIFGHTPNEKGLGKPIIQDNKIGLDGAVCPPGCKNLIGLELPKEKFYIQKYIPK